MNASSLYLQEYFGKNIEFPNNGTSELDHFHQGMEHFYCYGWWKFSNKPYLWKWCRHKLFNTNIRANKSNYHYQHFFVWSISVTPSYPKSSTAPPMFGIKVVRADLGENGWPVNIQLHNMTK